MANVRRLLSYRGSDSATPIKQSAVCLKTLILSTEAVLEAMTHDKKAAEGALRWVLLEAAGRAAVHRDVPSGDVERVVRDLAQ